MFYASTAQRSSTHFLFDGTYTNYFEPDSFFEFPINTITTEEIDWSRLVRNRHIFRYFDYQLVYSGLGQDIPVTENTIFNEIISLVDPRYILSITASLCYSVYFVDPNGNRKYSTILPDEGFRNIYPFLNSEQFKQYPKQFQPDFFSNFKLNSRLQLEYFPNIIQESVIRSERQHESSTGILSGLHSSDFSHMSRRTKKKEIFSNFDARVMVQTPYYTYSEAREKKLKNILMPLKIHLKMQSLLLKLLLQME